MRLRPKSSDSSTLSTSRPFLTVLCTPVLSRYKYFFFFLFFFPFFIQPLHLQKKTEDNTAVKAEGGDADKGKLKTTKKKLHPAPSLMVAAGQTGKPIGKSQSHHHLLDSKHDPVSPLSPTPTSPDKPSGRIVRKSVSSKNISRGKSLGPGSLHVALDIAEYWQHMQDYGFSLPVIFLLALIESTKRLQSSGQKTKATLVWASLSLYAVVA